MSVIALLDYLKGGFMKVNENEVEEKLQEDIINEEVERNPVNSENVEPNKQIEKTQHVQRKVTKHTLRI